MVASAPNDVEQSRRSNATSAEEVEKLEQAHFPTTPTSSASSREDDTAQDQTRTLHPDSNLATMRTHLGMEQAFMQYLDRHPAAVKRIQDHRLQHLQTVGSTKVPQYRNLPSFGGSKPFPPPLPEREEYVVEFDGHEDPRHAQNWPMRKKLAIASILVLDALAATFASSAFSPTASVVGPQFDVGREVTTLGTSLFVLGYALGRRYSWSRLGWH